MGSFVFDNAHGRAVEWYIRAHDDGAPKGIIVVPVKRTSDTDATMRARTTLGALLGGITDEVTNTLTSGTIRHVLTATGTGQLLLPAIAYDTTNHWYPIDVADQTWLGVAPGDDWTDLIWCYAPDVAGADSTLVPMVCQEFGFKADNSNAFAEIADFFRALRNG